MYVLCNLASCKENKVNVKYFDQKDTKNTLEGRKEGRKKGRKEGRRKKRFVRFTTYYCGRV